MNNSNNYNQPVKPNSNTLLIGGVVMVFVVIVAVVVVYFMYFKKEPVKKEPVDCDGYWSQDTECPVDCGQSASKVTETFSVTTPMANGGTECSFADGETREGTCPETDECPVDCVGAWEEAVCPASCEGTTVEEIYNVTVTGNETGNKCPFENGAARDKMCPAVPSECVGPEYDPTTVYTGASMDNYANYCSQMVTDEHCSKDNVKRNCRNECKSS